MNVLVMQRKEWDRNIKKENKFPGRRKLADKIVKKLNKYYGLSIQKNIDSVSNLKKAILDTYYHIFSTKKNPQHDNCSTDVIS